MQFFQAPARTFSLIHWREKLKHAQSRTYPKRRGQKQATHLSAAYESLESRTLLASLVASFGNDFPLPGELPGDGWQYQWNAPEGGDSTTGSIDDPTTKFVPLQFTGTGTSWTPDGDLIPGNHPLSAYLRLSAHGGHPGVGDGHIISEVARFAIASFTVEESGFYEITNSFIGLNPFHPLALTDGVEFRVFINHESPLESGVVDKNSRAYFDTTLGFLTAGDSIHVAFGASGNQTSDYFTTDFDIERDADREQTVGNFGDDFLTTNPGEFGWNYYWNAPDGWTGGESTGNKLTGAIGDPANYLPLEFAGSHWTADGDLSGLNSAPDYFLRFHPRGGHVGSGFQNPAFHDRFAIAAYTVEHSGMYGIANSFVSVADASLDGIEVLIHVENRSPLSELPLVVEGGQTIKFDSRLGYLQKGDTVYVGFGANHSHSFDNFKTDFSIVRILPRAAPDLGLLDHDGEIVSVNVARFGDGAAIPDDNLDDWKAIKNALTYAQATGAKEIHFDQGTYNLSSNGLEDLKPLFAITRINGLLINGNDSTLIVDDYTRPLFYTHGSSDIIFKDLTIDYAELVPARGGEANELYKPLTFTQGVISDLDRNNNTFTLTVNTDAFVAPDVSFESPNSEGWGYAVNRNINGRLKQGTDWHYRTLSVEPGETSTRFDIAVHHTNGLANGDRYVMQRRHNVAMFGNYTGSRNISLVNVTAYAAPSVFISSVYSDSINVIDSHVVIRPDDWPETPNTQRWKSINADGVHIQSNRIGAWVEDSTFSGTGDDVMNFYTRPMTVHEIVSETEFTLATIIPKAITNLPSQAIQVGDQLTFFNPVEGHVIKEVRVIAVNETMLPDPATPNRLVRMQTVTLDQPVQNVVQGSHLGPGGYLNDTTVFNHHAMQGSLVQDNLISNARRYGNYLMTSNVQLIDNVYEGLSDEAIAANNEPSWPLGPFSHDVLIQGNQFINNGFSDRFLNDTFHTGTVTFKTARYVNPGNPNNESQRPDHLVDAHDYVFKNIQILDNVFYHWNKSAISIRNAENVVVAGNSVSAGISTNAAGEPDSPFDIHFAKNVVLENNAYVGNGSAVSSSETDGLTDATTQIVHDGGLQAWFKFDRGAVLTDSSGNRSVASFNSAGISVAGKFDSAPVFNSTNSVAIDDGNESDIAKRSISMWFEVNDVGVSSRKQVVYEQGNSSDGLNIYVEDGQLYVGGWAAGSFSTFLNTSVESGRWHHVALVIDGDFGKLRGYLDGHKFGYDQATAIPNTPGEISLGRVGSTGTRFHSGVVIGHSHGLQGKIDEVRIYDRVLGDAEVAALAERR